MDQLPERYLDQFDGASRADAAVPDPGPLPLRGRYLPDLKAVRELPDRLCAGGVLTLCAIARSADPYRGEPDYALLVPASG